MDIRITPAVLSGEVHSVPSKSAAHRLLICAALSERPTFLQLCSLSQDIEATIRCLTALGAGFQRMQSGILVMPLSREEQRSGSVVLDCDESGSALRFLLPVACAIRGEVQFTAEGKLPQRPIEGLLLALEAGGVHFSSHTLPFTASGLLHGGTFSVPGNISSQYISGLLMALPLLGGGRIVLTTPLESKAYVDLTIDVLRQFGVAVQAEDDGYKVPDTACFRSPREANVEGDWSSAAFFLAAGALGSPVSIGGLTPNSLQADRSVLPHLRRFGAISEWHEGWLTVKPSSLHGCEIDISQSPDLLPILAVVASQAEGVTRFTHAKRLRLKESDRIATTAAMLRTLGCHVETAEDELTVSHSTLTGGTVDGAHDHRIVMAAAIAALVCRGPVVITGYEAAAKSYPAFFHDYQSLGGNIHVL